MEGEEGGCECLRLEHCCGRGHPGHAGGGGEGRTWGVEDVRALVVALAVAAVFGVAFVSLAGRFAAGAGEAGGRGVQGRGVCMRAVGIAVLE